MSRAQYQRLIEDNLRPHLGADYKYKKNSKDMYQLLRQYGSIANAMEHAKKLATRFGDQQDYGTHNPRTSVHLLVEELFTVKRK